MPQKERNPRGDKAGPRRPSSQPARAVTAIPAQPAALAQRAQSDPQLLSSSDVQHLQRKLGNRAVAQLLSGAAPRPVVQAKLTVGAANDPYEQEAERVAAQVVSPPASPSPTAQRAGAQDGLQAQRLAGAAPQVPFGSFEAGAQFEQGLSAARGGGMPLPAAMRQVMEQRIGADFSGVRVHMDAQSDQLNRSIQAKAFTTGPEVFFRAGAYEPASRDGQSLIAHELTHVVQQGAAAPVIQRFLTFADWNPPKKRIPEKVGFQLGKRTGLPGDLKPYQAAIQKLQIPDEHLPALFARLDAWAKDNVERELTIEEATERAWRETRPQAQGFNEEAFAQYNQAVVAYNQTLANPDPPDSGQGTQIPLTRDIWQHVLTFLTEWRRIENRLVFTNPRDLSALTRVCHDMRFFVRSLLTIHHGVDLPRLGQRVAYIQRPGGIFDEHFPVMAQIGDFLLHTYPPNQFVYLVPGASLLPVAVYMQHARPDVQIVNMPISGLSASDLAQHPRRFAVGRFAPFYHFYLSQFLGPSGESQPGQPRMLTPNRRLLLMDYSASGSTVNLISRQFIEYLESLNIPNARQCVETFAFGTPLIDQIQRQGDGPAGAPTAGARLNPAALEQFRLALKSERLKGLELVPYNKPRGQAALFTGELSNRSAQPVNIENLMVLWALIRRAMAQRSPTAPRK